MNKNKEFKILIINQPSSNRGDESAHKAIVRSISRSFPNAIIQVLFIRGNQDSINQFSVQNQKISYINVHSLGGRLRSLLYKTLLFTPVLLRIHPTIRKVISLFKNADIILCAPGGICMGGFQNWEHISLLMVAKLLNKPVFYYGRSIGPFPTLTLLNRLFKKRSLELMHYFSFFSLRDKKSEFYAQSLNIKYESTVDSAFLETPQINISKEISDTIGIKPYIVFVPNLLIWHFAYKDKASLKDIFIFYKKILDCIIFKYPNHNILMLPQVFNNVSYLRNDVNFFKEFKLYTKCEKLIILPDTYSSDIQQTIISKADCMVGARYHSIVFAINQGIPFVALSYEHKISGLLEVLNKTDSMVDITRIFDSEENMQTAIDQFAKALNYTSKDISAQEKAKQIAQECFDKFKQKIYELLKNEK